MNNNNITYCSVLLSGNKSEYSSESGKVSASTITNINTRVKNTTTKTNVKYSSNRTYKFKNDKYKQTFNKTNDVVGKKNNIWCEVDETWEDYLRSIKKANIEINLNGEKNCDWIYRIMEGKQELEFVECVTKDFLIIPTEFCKLDEIIQFSPNNFNLIVIPFDLELKSIRDLKIKHIPLLYDMKNKAIEVIINNSENFDINKLYFEFHYTPSTYHLHLHVGIRESNELEYKKRHLIHKFDDVIKNLLDDENYYKRPLKIKVRNVCKWRTELENYSKFNICDGTKLVQDEIWKIFVNMECYKKYN